MLIRPPAPAKSCRPPLRPPEPAPPGLGPPGSSTPARAAGALSELENHRAFLVTSSLSSVPWSLAGAIAGTTRGVVVFEGCFLLLPALPAPFVSAQPQGTAMLWTLWWHPQVPVTTRNIPKSGLLSAQLGNAYTKSILIPSVFTFPCPNSSDAAWSLLL